MSHAFINQCYQLSRKWPPTAKSKDFVWVFYLVQTKSLGQFFGKPMFRGKWQPHGAQLLAGGDRFAQSSLLFWSTGELCMMEISTSLCLWANNRKWPTANHHYCLTAVHLRVVIVRCLPSACSYSVHSTWNYYMVLRLVWVMWYTVLLSIWTSLEMHELYKNAKQMFYICIKKL